MTAKLLAETLPALAEGQEHCPECEGQGGFDPDEIPAAPVVCPVCEGTGVVDQAVLVDHTGRYRSRSSEEPGK